MKIPLWLTVGILAGLWMPVADALGAGAWPLFVAWGAFFVAGADLSALKKVYPNLLMGVVFGYLTIFFGVKLLSAVLGPVGVPLFVGLSAAILVILGKFNLFSLTPVAFFAFATYFGSGLDMKTTLIGLLLGPVVGYISVKVTTILTIFNQKNNSHKITDTK